MSTGNNHDCTNEKNEQKTSLPRSVWWGVCALVEQVNTFQMAREYTGSIVARRTRQLGFELAGKLIENSLHFLKDRWWDEDSHHTRRPGLSACMAAIHNAALSIHRLRSDPDLPVRAAADFIAWRPAIGIQPLNS
jgi:hypothetical protein